MENDWTKSVRERARRRRARLLGRQHLAVALAALLVVVLVAACARILPGSGSGPRVAAIDDRDYFPAVHQLLTGAQRSIDAVLYQSRFYFEYPLSSSNTLIADLADASRRGVRVRVVLEAADWNYGNTEDNRDVASILRDAGVETYFDPVGTTSHSKLLVVDRRYSVVGSMNWSYYALEKNIEATALVESERVARSFSDYFNRLVAASSADYPLPLAPIKAADFKRGKAEDVLIVDVVDSASYSPGKQAGWLRLGRVSVRVEDDALEEVLALDSLFFDGVEGDTVRIFGASDRETERVVRALDIETPGLGLAMDRAFAAEREQLKSKSVPKPVLSWQEAAGVTPVPNETYAPKVGQLIRGARTRVWLALLDARRYDKRPPYAESEPRQGPAGPLPSVSNALLDDLRAAAGRGVDVRLVIDMGLGGQVPATKTAFLDSLQASGGKVYEDPRGVTTHAKVLIVDDDYTVVGSTNWSQPALEENNETAVIIEAREINQHYARLIARAGADFASPRGPAGAPKEEKPEAGDE